MISALLLLRRKKKKKYPQNPARARAEDGFTRTDCYGIQDTDRKWTRIMTSVKCVRSGTRKEEV